MGSATPVTQLSVSAASHSTQAVVPDPDFDARWIAWIARGRAQEQRARRRFLIWAPVVAIGAAIVVALLRS
jgi:hypothetical protein